MSRAKPTCRVEKVEGSGSAKSILLLKLLYVSEKPAADVSLRIPWICVPELYLRRGADPCLWGAGATTTAKVLVCWRRRGRADVLHTDCVRPRSRDH